MVRSRLAVRPDALPDPLFGTMAMIFDLPTAQG
jgi:hypothetical protein